nr:RNA-dependent RNA polymerase [Mute swan feces associated noda-like virus 7]
MFNYWMKRYVWNPLLERNHQGDLTVNSEFLRDWFSKTDFAAIAPYPNHTHGDSAAKRTIGSNFIEQLSETAGERPLYFQGSAADLRKGREVSREWYWAKDLSMTPIVMPPSLDTDPGRIIAMVDVDEYVDMEHELCVHFNPHVIYTFQPSAAGKSEGEYTYRFLADGRVEFVVSGGGVYKHHVWDYGHDAIRCESTEWLWFNTGLVFPVRIFWVAYYKVERRNVDADHQVILLSPMKRWGQLFPGGFADIAIANIEAQRLKRLNPVKGDFVRLEIMTPSGMQISTARVGQYSCASASAAVDEEIALKSHLTKDKLTVAMSKSSLSSEKQDFRGAEVLTAYHREASGATARMFHLDDGVRSYQFLPKLADYDPEVPPSMHGYMKPLLHGGFAPSCCENNDRRAVAKRITEVRSNAKLTNFLKTAIRNFVDLVAKEILIPVDEEEVYARQKRPTQRAILETSNYVAARGTARTFMKRQAETKIGDPRLITPIEGETKRDYSSFMYALAEYLKKLPWYISGMKPREIAERVALLGIVAKWLAETDFSRMDGRVGEVLRYLEKVLMMTLFPQCYHREILELMKKQTWLRCFTTFGVEYNTEFARGSGSPETSCFNTLAAAFVIFLAYLLMGLTSEAAFEKLGAFCGDDGLTPDLDAEKAVKAARMVGQKLTIKIVPHGENVSFLSRHYGPGVWFGETDSTCDLRRQLAKFHLSVTIADREDAVVRKLREKSFAFYLTDEHSPVLGPYVKKVLQLCPVQHGEGDGFRYENIHRIWNSEIPKEDQYPSLESGYCWKRELFEQQLPDFSVSDFELWVCRCSTLDDLMNPPEPVILPAIHPGGGDGLAIDGDFVEDSNRSVASTRTKRGTRGGRRKKTMDKAKPSEKTQGKTPVRHKHKREHPKQEQTQLLIALA